MDDEERSLLLRADGYLTLALYRGIDEAWEKDVSELVLDIRLALNKEIK